MLAVLPVLASCVGAVSRSEVVSFLEAVQRPFDLHDRTWLGVPGGADFPLGHFGAPRRRTRLALALQSRWNPPRDPDSDQGGRGLDDHCSLPTRDLGLCVRWSYFVGQSEGDLKVDSDGLQSPRGPA